MAAPRKPGPAGKKPKPRAPRKSKPAPAPTGWSRGLSRVLELDRAPVDRLATLKDAAELLARHFPAGNSPANATAARLLIQAADSGAAEDVAAATEQMARILRFRRWLP